MKGQRASASSFEEHPKSNTIDMLVTLCDRAFKDFGIVRLARVHEDPDSVDLLYLDHAGAQIIVRCVPFPRGRDFDALQTMLREGPFDRAILVHDANSEGTKPASVEVWPHSQLVALQKA